MLSTRRDHLIDTALELFNQGGYHAVGIDKILAESGVAKMTLYKHFRSKDELILAALSRRDERWLNWLRDAVASRAASPRGRLLAVYDVLSEWFEAPDFNGCMFIKAAGEFAEAEDPIHAACAAHQRRLFDYLRDLAAAAGSRRPAKLARELMLLVVGAIVVTQVNGAVDAAAQARETARVLIAHALGEAAK